MQGGKGTFARREGKLLTTKYSEREIRVTKRERGEIIQQPSLRREMRRA